ncbi:MAG: hypothetical protein AAF517_19115, partial [Planctomycetota bacterium]
LKFDASDAWNPAPGEYTFRCVVYDANCAASVPGALTVLVEAFDGPDFEVAVEDEQGSIVGHLPGSGEAQIPAEGAHRLVVTARTDSRLAALDQDSLSVSIEPPLGGDIDEISAADFVNAGENRLAFDFLAEDLALGNTTFTVSGSGIGTARREVRRRVEIAIDYHRDIQPIWTADCTGCHEAPDPFQGLEIVGLEPGRSRDRIANVFASQPRIDSSAPLLVWPFFPERSYLFHKLRGTHLQDDIGGSGDRMPQGGGFLGDERLRLIESWILQGAE